MSLQKTCRTTMLLLVCGLAARGGYGDETVPDENSTRDDARSAAELLPPTTIFYAEMSDPPGLITQLAEHPLRKQLQQLAAFQQLLTDPKYVRFQAQRRGVEALLGHSWREIIDILSAQGIIAAFDAQTQGACLLTKGRDAAELDRIVNSLLTLARQDASNKGRPDPFAETAYRGVKVYQSESGGLAVQDGWLILVNNADLGRQILDTLLDSTGHSLAGEPTFVEAQQNVPRHAAAWAYLNLVTIREGDPGNKAFSGRADDPAGELILGGVLEILAHAPWLTAAVTLDEDHFGLRIRMPQRAEWISEQREHFFGPGGTGTAPPPLDVPGTLLSLTAYRNVSQMWLRAGDLFDARVNDNLAQAEGTLTTLFSGRDFAEEVLGEISPQIQLLAVQQPFDPDQPVPDLKLPAFALIAGMKDPASTRPEFRRIFQSLVGFLNVVGAQNAQPQLELHIEQFGDAEVVSSRFVPDAAVAVQQQTAIHFNFSPAIAFAGERLILSSTEPLARVLVEATPRERTNDARGVNSQLTLHAAPLHDALDANRQHLVARNMLNEGHSHDEAERQIATVLDLLSLLESSSMELVTGRTTLDLNVTFELRGQK